MSSQNLGDYSYLQNEALKALQESTKTTLRENDIAFDVLLTLDKSDLNEQLKISFGDTKRILKFIEENKSSSSPNSSNTTSSTSAAAKDTSNTTSTAVKDTNIGGNLLSGVTAQNIDAHTEVHNITNIIQQAQTHSSPKKLAVESLPRVNKKSFDLSDDKIIVSGATSNIYSYKSKGQTIALKIYHSLVSNKTLQRDITSLSFLRHPNVLPVYGLIVDSDNDIVGYMMEKMSRSLQALLDNKEAISKISQQQKIIWLIQISSALVYSHDSNIFHADINPENILLTESTPAICKIADFGSAQIIATSNATAASAFASSNSIRGTCGFIAPECLMGEIKKPTAACDVFSFGMLIWCLFFPGVDNELGKTETNINFAIISGKRPKISSSSIPAEIQKLTVECWDQNADIRPTMTSVLAKLERIVVDSGKSATSSESSSQQATSEEKADCATQEGESLSFAFDQKITNEELIEKVRECKNLVSLNVRCTTKITDKSISWIADHCKNLTSLYVSDTKLITDASIFAVSNCHNLTKLGVRSTTGITDASISQISASCKKLVYLCVYDTNGKITKASLDKIRESNPNCEICE